MSSHAVIGGSILRNAVGTAYPRVPGGTLRADVAVVGGGLTGLSVTYHLLLRDPAARVVVLEADRIGAGASTRNTGTLGPRPPTAGRTGGLAHRARPASGARSR